MSEGRTLRRNLGPEWGFRFLLEMDRVLPHFLVQPVLMLGTWVALACMPVQRRYAREYLAVALRRPPGILQVWEHFFALTEALLLLLRAGRGLPVRCTLDPHNAAGFEALVRSPRPALFGTFHVGASDLLGYVLSDWNRPVSILRLQVGNSTDTDLLGRRFGGQVSFLWVNDPARMIFDLKTALESGRSLAMKCDRLEFSARAEPFEFLGARRLFPFTIYHLAILFGQPVVFCTAVAVDPQLELRLFASPVFTPDPAAGREANLAAARVHFQAVLRELENLLRREPYLWFNFLPLNPAVSPA